MAQPVNTIIEVGVEGEVNGQKMLTVLHYQIVAPVAVFVDNIAEMTAFLQELNGAGTNFLVQKYREACSVDYTLDRLRGQFIQPTRLSYVSIPVGNNGTVLEDCRAQNVSGVITKRGPTAQRKDLGSVHMPGVPVGGYLIGDITLAQKTRYNAVAIEMAKTVSPPATGGVYQPVIWHRNEVWPGNTSAIQEWLIQGSLRVMRRRTVGLGI